MKVYQTKDIRNIALLGSSGSGKTTFAESILLEGGIIKRRGSIDAGTTVSDYFPVEKEYGYSVFSTLISVEFNDRKLNFIDCPGSDDFAGAIISALTVADTAVMTVNAQYGIEVGMINQFRLIEKLNKPSLFVINQLDSDKADYEHTIAQLKERYGSKIVPVQYPLNPGPNFDTIIDVLMMKMYKYGKEGEAPVISDIPDDEMDRAKALHQALVESAAENDEALMEMFFDKGTLTEDEMRSGIRAGLLARSIIPVFCISAVKCVGVSRAMEFLGNVVPSPAKLSAVLDEKGNEVVPDPTALTSVYFFKSSVEPHIGEVSYFKVMSGTLQEGTDLDNTTRGSKERIQQLFVCAGQTRTAVPQMVAGDLGATVKLKDVRRGNTLNAKGSNHTFDLVEYPAPKYRRAIKAKNEADTEKLSESLLRMHEEDPTWVVEQSKELRQMIVLGQGEFHLRTLKWRIEHNDKIEIDFMEPRIPYRETITKPARADYRHKKQSGGAGQFGEVHLIVEPYEDGKPMPTSYKFNGQEFKITPRDTQEINLDWGGKLIFVNSIVGGAIDARFMPAILKGVMSRMERGPLTGSYARDVRVIVYDGKMHPVDSNEVSFMLAGRNAFSEAFKNAVPKVLEPVYNVEVSVPADYMGDVISDLQSRRAMIMGMDSKKGYELIKAKVPLAEMSSYSTALSSVTGGRASFIMSFSGYELVPGDVQEKLLAAYAAEQEAED